MASDQDEGSKGEEVMAKKKTRKKVKPRQPGEPRLVFIPAWELHGHYYPMPIEVKNPQQEHAVIVRKVAREKP